MKYNEAET